MNAFLNQEAAPHRNQRQAGQLQARRDGIIDSETPGGDAGLGSREGEDGCYLYLVEKGVRDVRNVRRRKSTGPVGKALFSSSGRNSSIASWRRMEREFTIKVVMQTSRSAAPDLASIATSLPMGSAGVLAYGDLCVCASVHL